jgi:RNA polymerase-binding protein DksA
VAKKSPAKVKLIKPSKDKASTSKPASKSSATGSKSSSAAVKSSSKSTGGTSRSASTKSVKPSSAGTQKAAAAGKIAPKSPSKSPVAKVVSAKSGASKSPSPAPVTTPSPSAKAASPAPATQTVVTVKPKSLPPVIPARGSDNAGNSGALTDEQLLKAKSGLSKRDIDVYRKTLMDKRAEILGDVASLETDARNKNTGGNLSNMPVHMADIGTDNFQQEFTLGLVESERKLLAEINAALLRIQKGTFGVCLETGKPIGKPRLDATPWARYCIEVARDMERRGRRH